MRWDGVAVISYTSSASRIYRNFDLPSLLPGPRKLSGPTRVPGDLLPGLQEVLGAVVPGHTAIPGLSPVLGANKHAYIDCALSLCNVTLSHMMSHIERLFKDDTPHYSSFYFFALRLVYRTNI